MGKVIYILGLLGFGAGIFFLDGVGWNLSVGFGIFWFISGLFLMSVFSDARKEEKAPKLVVHAKVFGKTVDTSGGGTSYVGNNLYASDKVITKHFVSFEFNGHRKNFEVDVNQFNTIAENDSGMLTYKDFDNKLIFISFQRDAR